MSISISDIAPPPRCLRGALTSPAMKVMMITVCATGGVRMDLPVRLPAENAQ